MYHLFTSGHPTINDNFRKINIILYMRKLGQREGSGLPQVTQSVSGRTRIQGSICLISKLMQLTTESGKGVGRKRWNKDPQETLFFSHLFLLVGG